MPTLTVELARTYSLSLKDGKAARVTWQGMAGKNKLRRFFVHPKWEDYIARVSVSSAGAKGGVFFLEAYEVTPAAFLQATRALNVTMEASAAWRRLHRDNHLAGGTLGRQQALALGTQALPALVAPQVMQPGFTFTNVAYGKNATARNALLAALQNAAQLRKRYVVKGTNEPGRALFAEYVLNTIGKAKIPKSLVLEIDPSRPSTHADPSEGMIMLDLINTRRHPGADGARYDAAYANLHNGAQSVVDYLVVQKLLAGATIADQKSLNAQVAKFLCDQKIIVGIDSFAADANFAGESRQTLYELVTDLHDQGCLRNGLVTANYQANLNNLRILNNKRNEVDAVLTAALPVLGANQLDPQDYDKTSAEQFDQLVDDLQNQPATALTQALAQFLAAIGQDIATNERILSDVEMIRNTARVHFADALLGNGDRFAQLNPGNMFYVTRQTAQGSPKADNPVGCIDNDSFLPTYLPSQHKEGIKGGAVGYATRVLKPTAELWGWNAAKPPGMVMAPNMSVYDALDYDTWFPKFYREFVSSGGFDDLPVAVLGLYSANFFAPGDRAPYTNTQALPAWARVHRSLTEGVASALSNYLRTDIREFQAVYDALTSRYYPGPNFEFTAFEIRDRYLRQCQVDRQNWTVGTPALPPNNALLKELYEDIADWLITAKKVSPECGSPQVSPIADRALSTGVQLGHINAADRDEIRRVLLTMAVSDQERLLPNPFATGSIPILSDTPARTIFDENWSGLKSKYRNRMAVVVCTLLQRFSNEYNAEVGYITHDRRRVLQSKAFKAADALGQQVSGLRLAKDEGYTSAIRTQVLGNQLNLPNYVTAS